jgi:hypothetical protein
VAVGRRQRAEREILGAVRVVEGARVDPGGVTVGAREGVRVRGVERSIRGREVADATERVRRSTDPFEARARRQRAGARFGGVIVAVGIELRAGRNLRPRRGRERENDRREHRA